MLVALVVKFYLFLELFKGLENRKRKHDAIDVCDEMPQNVSFHIKDGWLFFLVSVSSALLMKIWS